MVAATETVEPAAETPAAPVEAATETAAVTEAAKPEEKKSRRGSKFIDRLKSFGSPTQEKKPEEVIPAPAAVEEAPAAATEPAATEPVAEAPEAAVAATTEAEPTTNGDHKAEEKPAEAAAGC